MCAREKAKAQASARGGGLPRAPPAQVLEERKGWVATERAKAKQFVVNKKKGKKNMLLVRPAPPNCLRATAVPLRLREPAPAHAEAW